MQVSGGALIRPRGVLVELGGHEYRIPPTPAAQWMLTILEGGWADIVPGMCDGDLDELHDAIATGTITPDDCESSAQDALAAAAGVDWWVAIKLVHSAAADPAAFGELRTSGLEVETAPLGAALVALYRIYTREKDKKEILKLDAELEKVPAGVSAVEVRYDATAAAAAFEEQFAKRGGR